MNLKKFLDSMSMEKKELNYKLSIVFAFFFIVPLLGFVYFGMKYNILEDQYTPLFAIGLLLSAFFGYTIIRKIFDDIRTTSLKMAESISSNVNIRDKTTAGSEMEGIVQSFQSLERELRSSFRHLDRRVSQISTLKELSELCYVTFDTEDLFYITLERALKLANADIGSVMILEQPKREAFILQANIGHSELKSKGDRIAFADSLAKYAVINKSPLLVENIETDIRFGRSNRAPYGTKSFLCMPLKGIKEVIGVVTISRRDSELPFTQDDIEVLTPLLSSTAFTYDNLHLMKKNDLKDTHLKVLDDMLGMINSSLRDSELLTSLLKQVQLDIPCDLAMIFLENESKPGHLNIVEFLGAVPMTFSWQECYPYAGTIIDRVINQGTPLTFNYTGKESNAIEEMLFMKHYLRSCLLVPLKGDGMIKGLLALGSLSPSAFGGVQDRAGQLANIVAMAIEKNRLSASVIKRNREMGIVKQIGSLLAASTFDMQEVLGHTMDLIRATLEVEAGSLMLLEKDELVFNVAFNVSNGIDIGTLKTLRLKLGQGIAGYCAARGEPIIVPNVKESKQFCSEFDRVVGFTTNSILCVPLISLGRVIGVIEVINKLGGEFNDNDLRLLQSIATSVTIALENARLYRETLSMAEHERDIRKIFQKFVPKEIVDKITCDLNGDKPVTSELKTITLMNIDIRGFSFLARRLGPQKTVSLLNHFFSTMGEIVFDHHGIVDKYLGDGFLALFGAPVTDINDADHALAAALEMRDAILPINEHFNGELEKPLTIGISIHTGEAVIGNIGFDKKMDYTVIGDSVNAVFRLQDLTRTLPNGILVSEKTCRALADTSPLLRDMGLCDAGSTLGELRIYELMGCK